MSNLKTFFDDLASDWDKKFTPEDFVNIEKIISLSEIKSNDVILDVACGTGVLTPYFIKANIKNITAVDISEKMLKELNKKHPSVTTIHMDYQKKYFNNEQFSKIFIFNALPHFDNHKKVFELSYDYLKDDGKLIIAHSIDREKLSKIHSKNQQTKGHELPTDEQLIELYSSGFSDIKLISKDFIFAIGTKKRRSPWQRF